MEIQLIGKKHAVLVRVRGELDHCLAEKMRGAIDEAIRRSNAIHVIFDFSEVPFMDSSGIGMIMGRYRAVQALGGQIFLFGAGKMLRRIIEMSGIGTLVHMADSYEQTIKRMEEVEENGK